MAGPRRTWSIATWSPTRPTSFGRRHHLRADLGRLLDCCRFRSHYEAALAVFDFLEGWYNTRRRHSALGYLSPINLERKMTQAA
jgi:transposase InsO family protein